MKEPKQPSVRLLSWTGRVVETIFVEWMISRQNEAERIKQKYLVNPFEPTAVFIKAETDKEFKAEVRKVFEDCVSMKVPLAETISFVWAVEGMPLSMRDQLVRHRVGHKFGEQFGFEHFPNQHDSSFWSESFRAKDLSKFAANGDYYEPEWLKLWGDKLMQGHGHENCPECSEPGKYLPGVGKYRCVNGHEWEMEKYQKVRTFYREQMGWMASAYQRMLDAGMPPEDARNILPMGGTCAMTWSCNISSIMHVLSKRGCWIAQLGMWEPVIRGMVNELANKVDPYFRRLIDPPCIGEDGEFDACRYHKENQEYIRGTDPHHPCPLWLYNHGATAFLTFMETSNPTWEPRGHGLAMLDDNEGRQWRPVRPNVTGTVEAERKDFLERGNKYAELWGRKPTTGERVRLL